MSKITSDPHELYRFLATPDIEVTNLLFASDGIDWASWRFIAEETIPSFRHTNEVIAAYVAADGRMCLYSYLERLQKRVIYCDTDSAFYIQEENESGGGGLLECADNPGYKNERTETRRIHRRIYYWSAKQLCLQVRQKVGCYKATENRP